MKLTYYGHASFSVEIQGKKILFDPFITPNELARHIDINTIECDYIAISHGHGDHLADAVAIAKRTQAIVICSYEVYEWLAKQGLEKFRPMNTGGKWATEFGAIKCVVAQHSSCLPDGSNGGNPMGFVVTSSEGDFYYSGDTAVTMDMQLIPHWANLDFAVFPIGDNFTMGADDAIMASDFCLANKVVGVHYDTFPYIVIDHAKALEAFEKKGKELILLEIGETRDI